MESKSAAVQGDTMRFFLALLTLATSAQAQDGVRSSDALMTAADLDALLSGHVIEFYDGSKSRYAADGLYGYTYTDDGPVWSGRYRTQDDSRLCVDFDNGFARCDVFVMDGNRLVLVTADGTRFPIRNIIVDRP